MRGKPKWIAMGDVNPRDYGGIYARVWPNGGEIEIVKIDPVGEDPKNGYNESYGTYKREELQEVMDTRCQPYDFADLERLKDQPFEEIVHFIALAKMDYYGSSEEIEQRTNFWKTLRRFGIRPDNIE